MENAQQIMQAIRDAFAKDLTRFVGQQDRSGWTLTLSGINQSVTRAYEQLYPGARVDVDSELNDDGTVDVNVRIFPRYITVEFTVEPAKKPADPSPTPWDHSTWGFYCDSCDRFFDLVTDGKVLTHEDNTCTRYHNCGAEARYIGYDHSAQK